MSSQGEQFHRILFLLVPTLARTELEIRMASIYIILLRLVGSGLGILEISHKKVGFRRTLRPT